MKKRMAVLIVACLCFTLFSTTAFAATITLTNKLIYGGPSQNLATGYVTAPDTYYYMDVTSLNLNYTPDFNVSFRTYHNGIATSARQDWYSTGTRSVNYTAAQGVGTSEVLKGSIPSTSTGDFAIVSLTWTP